MTPAQGTVAPAAAPAGPMTPPSWWTWAGAPHRRRPPPTSGGQRPQREHAPAVVSRETVPRGRMPDRV